LIIVSKILSPDDFLDFGNPLTIYRTATSIAALSLQIFGRVTHHFMRRIFLWDQFSSRNISPFSLSKFYR
jgi:hypothetical protein